MAEGVGTSADWPQILQLYTVLLTMEPTPVVRVNLAVALAETGNLAAALALLNDLRAELADFQPFHAALAAVLAKSGDKAGAQQAYSVAIKLASNDNDRLFLAGQARRLV